MNLTNCKTLLEALNLLMDKKMSEPQNQREVCYDGAVNVEKYYSSEIKIVWLLKEPYDGEDGTGGGFSLADLIKEGANYGEFVKHFPTWQVINYISYGILNNFAKWNDMDYLSDNPEMIEALQKIAVVNAQKLPSLNQTRTIDSDLVKSIATHGDLLSAQINLLNPDVLIGGRTLWLYKEMFELDKGQWGNLGSADYWKKDDKLYIDAYHPAQTQVTREKYCDDIITLVESWRKGKL